MPKPRILLVDDDADFRAPIKAILMNEGLLVEEAASAQEMESRLNLFDADIVLLDVNLPDDSGLNIVSRLKNTRHIDVIMLSALGDVEHRVNGISLGADYYLAKPVDMRELLAVIHNRLHALSMNQIKETNRWQLNTADWLFTTPDGRQHQLNSSELAILTLLAKQSRLGKPSTRDALYKALGNPNYSPNSRSLDLHISRMRQRFSNAAFQFPIKTIRNVGYELTEPMAIL
nr:response regulator transcription factor [uncultured Methylophaga sp.]